MRKGFVFVAIACILTAAVFLLFAAPASIACPAYPASNAPAIQSQNVDPFYLKLLEKGEQSYLAGDYEEAFRQLKTAHFGLNADKNLQARALTYMSLCAYFLKEVSQSKEYLEQALGLIGGAGVDSLDLGERVRGEITGLLARFELGDYAPQAPEFRVITKRVPFSLGVEQAGDDSGRHIEELEYLIKNNPAAIDNFYDLHDLYMEEGNTKKARETLEKMLKRHPDEVYGHYLLGLIRYREGKFKDAEEDFRESLKPRPNMMLEESFDHEIRAYYILSVYQRGDENRAYDIMAVSSHLFSADSVTALPLSGADKALLRQILIEYRRR